MPPLAGFAEMISADVGASTVAIAEAFVADGDDAYESIAESLTAWLLAPGSVSVEFATEVAADLGALTAGLHAALANAQGIPDFEPRPGDPRRVARLGPGGPEPAVARDRRRARRVRPVAARPGAADRGGALGLRGTPQPAAADPGPRRLPPRPGAHRARRLPHRRLRGRAASTARGATRAPEPAARRGLDAAIARPRGAQRWPASRDAQRRPPRAAGPRPRRLAPSIQGALPRRLQGRAARSRRSRSSWTRT